MRASAYASMPEPTVNIFISGGDTDDVSAGCFRAQMTVDEARTLRDLLTKKVRFARTLNKGRSTAYASAWQREER